MPGESDCHWDWPDDRFVSIHSRQLCRENLDLTTDVHCVELFQSTPGNYAGRIKWLMDGAVEYYGFNPLPAIMPGESI